jgi:hypothetical protein
MLVAPELEGLENQFVEPGPKQPGNCSGIQGSLRVHLALPMPLQALCGGADIAPLLLRISIGQALSRLAAGPTSMRQLRPDASPAASKTESSVQ